MLVKVVARSMTRWEEPERSERIPPIRSTQVVVRLKPSKLVEPSITATNTSVPRTCSAPARPVKGQRIAIEPSRTTKGAMRASRPKATAKPSPFLVHASRPYTAIPASAQYEYRAVATPSVGGWAASGCASSSVTNAKSAAAAGYLPQRPDHSSTGRASRPPSSTSQTVASAMARHGLRTLHTFPNRIERSGIPSQKTT